MKRFSELHDVNSDIKRLWTETGTDRPEQARDSLIPLSTDQDVARSREPFDQHNMSLEKANRRINRLLGEKKQLSALLDKRDVQIERLNREIGTYDSLREGVTARSHRTSHFRDPLATGLASVAERFRSFFGKRPEADNVPAGESQSDAPAASRHSRLVARHKADVGQQVVAVLLFGLARNEIERLLPIIERDCSAKRMVPLCLIDMDAFELLRGRRLIFEYFPPADDRDRFDSALNWDLYIQRRLALIRKKWDPVRLVAFGSPAMRTLTLWSSSPFEDTPLPAASSAKPAP